MTKRIASKPVIKRSISFAPEDMKYAQAEADELFEGNLSMFVRYVFRLHREKKK